MPHSARDSSTSRARSASAGGPCTPAHTTAGRRSFGKNPRPQKLRGSSPGGTTVERAPSILDSFSSETWPMNLSVTCKFAGLTHRGLESARRSSSRSDARFSRTSAEIESATKSRMSGANGRRLAVIKKMQTNHVERSLRSLHADHVAVADEANGAFADAGWAGERDVHRADRFFFAAATGPGDACNADA